MDTHENKKYDIPAKPESGARDPKNKHAQLDQHPCGGRTRPPQTDDEVQDATENKAADAVVTAAMNGCRCFQSALNQVLDSAMRLPDQG